MAAPPPIITFIFMLAEMKEGKKHTTSPLKDYYQKLYISLSLIAYWLELGQMATPRNGEPSRNRDFILDMHVPN